MSRVIISIANPIKFTPRVSNRPAQYNTIPFDEQQYYDRILPWYQQRKYFQKWQTTDAIRLQFIADFNPITVEVVDSFDIARITTIMTQKAVDENNPGFHVYEADISLASLAPGCYRLSVTFGSGGDVWDSEPIEVRTVHKHTVYIEYKNIRYKDGLMYETGFSPAFRVEGWLGRLKTGSKTEIWEDQPLNQSVISSRTYRVWPFHIGFTYGVPDWVLDKLNMILSCTDVMIDGQYFTKAEAGADFEETVIERYPMRGFVIDLRESLNRRARIIDPTMNTERKVVVVHNIETNLFGDLSSNAATNQVPVLGVE